MRECLVKNNRTRCNCSWEPCPRKGLCCECLAYHWAHEELPACLFPDSVEKTYDRSLRMFIETAKDKTR